MKGGRENSTKLSLECRIELVSFFELIHVQVQICFSLYSFTRSAIAKHHSLGSIKNRNLFSHNPEDLKSDIKVLA